MTKQTKAELQEEIEKLKTDLDTQKSLTRMKHNDLVDSEKKADQLLKENRNLSDTAEHSDAFISKITQAQGNARELILSALTADDECIVEKFALTTPRFVESRDVLLGRALQTLDSV